MSIKPVSLMIAFLLCASTLLSACASLDNKGGSSQTTPTVNTNENNPSTTIDAHTPTPAPIKISGAGATFPLPVYTEWMYAYQYVDPSVVITYQGIGSSGGKKGILERTLDFAGSDSILKEEEYAQGGDLQMYPMLAGAVVLIYNIEDLDPAQNSTLILDRQTLTNIFLGKVNQWNDPAILNLNPNLKNTLSAKNITTVHRSDGSGTTEIFTSALSLFSAEWHDQVGAGSEVEWPLGNTDHSLAGKGNQGVAATVLSTPNSIGYVELSYALANKLPYTQMINKAGNTVVADARSLNSAMEDFADAIDERLTVKIVDGGGQESWPIAGYTYIILRTNSMNDCNKVEKLRDYLKWTLTDPVAASRAADLGYSVLSESVRNIVLEKLEIVGCAP